MARVADDRFRIPLLPLGLGAVAIPLLVEAARWRARALRRASGCCVACGYSMTGAVSSRCPECGSDWAPRRGETTRSRRVEAWRRASRVAAAVMRSLLEILVGPAVVWFALHAWHTQLATRSTNGAFVLVLIAPVVGILVLGILIWATWAVTNRFDQLSSEKRRRQARQLAMIGAAVSQVSLIVLAFSK